MDDFAALPDYPKATTASPKRRDLLEQCGSLALVYRGERWWTDTVISSTWVIVIASLALALFIPPIVDAQGLAKRVAAIQRQKDMQLFMFHDGLPPQDP